MAMYTLNIRLQKPDRLTYVSLRKQDRGKSYETDIPFENYKPGVQVTNLQ